MLSGRYDDVMTSKW